MNSASQSESDLVRDVEQWTRAGRRLATPVWFALLCAGISILAYVPAALLIDSSGSGSWYWFVAAPLTAIASGWYFQSVGARPTGRIGLVVGVVGVVMLVAVLAIVGFGNGAFGVVTPWIVVGAGFGAFALAWRSWAAGAVAAASLVTSTIVGATDAANGELILVLVVGLTASVGAVIEVVRGVQVPSA